MKITHLIYSFTTGGAETMLVDIVNEQVKQTVVAIVIINNKYNDSLLKKIDPRVKVIFIKRTEGSKNPIPIIRLNYFLLKSDADVLHCHDHNIAPLFLPKLKKKTVLTVHDIGIDVTYYNCYKKIFAISKIVQSDIAKRANKYPVLVYNGVRITNILSKSNLKNQDCFKIVIVSRLMHEKKGQHLAIEALQILKEKGIVNIHLDLIGEGNSEQYLKDLTIRHGLSNQVKFLGLKDRSYIYSHLKDYDLLIQPSLYEGFGLTVAEGMAAKLPVLVSDIDGPMEIIEKGKYGYYFQSNNAESLAYQIQYIISNYTNSNFKAKINNAYNHVSANFDVKTTSKTYLNYYNK